MSSLSSSSSSSSSPSTPEWQLYYWPGLPGRAEFARLLFHETNTAYTEPFANSAFPQIQPQREQLSATQPFFAMPVLCHTPPGSTAPSIRISQSAVMCRYLSLHLDGGRLAARNERDDFRAQELLACAVDAVGEGCTAWHAIDGEGSYASQAKETQPFVDQFVSKRLPKWLAFFEKALQANGGAFFIGSELSYVDVFVFQWLHGVEFQCPEVYKSEAIDCLRGLKEQVEKRPGIAERVKARKGYDGTGPCF